MYPRCRILDVADGKKRLHLTTQMLEMGGGGGGGGGGGEPFKALSGRMHCTFTCVIIGAI